MSDIFIDVCLAGLFGGFLCSAAQLLIDLTKMTPARILTLYVCLGVLVYAIGIYDPLLEIFGAGISLPLIGFGANIGRGVFEAINKDGAIGILTGGLTAASAGITLALFLGLMASVIFKSGSKEA